MYTRTCIILFLISLTAFTVSAQRRTSARMPLTMDSIGLAPRDKYLDALEAIDDESWRRSDVFYDSLRSKSGKRAFPRLLHGLIVTRHKRDTTSAGRFINEANRLRQYEGRIIGSISIDRNEVFDENGNWLQRTSNNLHILTREQAIRRDLLYKPGDLLDPQLVVKNNQLIRDRDYISFVTTIVTPDINDSMIVNVMIHTLDKWTIGGDGNFHSDGESRLSVYDANILGTGNKLKISTYFDWKKWDYQDNIIEYNIPNIWGTFIQGNLQVGKGYEESVGRLSFEKQFIKHFDYNFGASYSDIKHKRYEMYYCDSTDVVGARSFEAYAGHSFYLPSASASLYVTGSYSYANFYKRPDATGPTFNPAFHNYDRALLALGIYREKFYTANLIYGYGFREYVATGYKFEIDGGYNWGEFRDDYYFGANASYGGYSRVGYFMESAAFGTFVDSHGGEWWRSTLDVDARWFSNLFISGRRSRMRQFLNLNYTCGWNRGQGADEVLIFDEIHGPRGIREHIIGRNRLALNTETVLFTPLNPIGFRIAFFGFADFAFMGNKNNPFSNEFFSAFGIGVRLRNERLVFNTIQIRLGLAVGSHGWIKNNIFRMNKEQRLEQYRFIPGKPEVVSYR